VVAFVVAADELVAAAAGPVVAADELVVAVTGSVVAADAGELAWAAEEGVVVDEEDELPSAGTEPIVPPVAPPDGASAVPVKAPAAPWKDANDSEP